MATKPAWIPILGVINGAAKSTAAAHLQSDSDFADALFLGPDIALP
jgi:hypothetical protein